MALNEYLTDPAAAIQLAVRATLLASPAMIAAFGTTPRVHDRVPPSSPNATQTATFPYCTIGEDQGVGDTNQAARMTETFVKVEVWSRSGDFIEAKTISAAVIAALDAYIPITGHRVVTHRLHGTLPRTEPDGLTRRVIVTLDYETQPAVTPPYIDPAADS